MKRIVTILLLSGLATPVVFGCACGPRATADDAPAVVATHTASLSITGMTCASCAVTVRTAAGKLGGVTSIDVDVAAGRATVHYDAGRVTAEQVAEAITKAGYTSTVESTSEV